MRTYEAVMGLLRSIKYDLFATARFGLCWVAREDWIVMEMNRFLIFSPNVPTSVQYCGLATALILLSLTTNGLAACVPTASAPSNLAGQEPTRFECLQGPNELERSSGVETGQVRVDPSPVTPTTPAHQPARLLPFFAEEARKLGVELPLPYGIAPTFTYMAQDFGLRDLKIGIGAAAPKPLAFLQFDPARIEAKNELLRLDAWVFPFLNVYGLLGHTSGRGTTTVTIPPIPFLAPQPSRVPVTISYDGATYGAGAVVVGGYRELFVMADGNFTTTDLRGAFTSDIKTFVFATRAGWNGRVGWFKGQAWVGAMYQEQSQLLSGTTMLNSGQPLTFEIKQKAIGRWNTLLGISWDITPHIVFLLEGGLGERKQVTTSVGARF